MIDLDSLPEDTEYINILGKFMMYLPDLTRFKNLKILNCSYNKLTSLPPLNENLEILYCHNNKLTYLPNLPKSLITLHCYENKLSNLPDLPDSLILLNCSENKLISLPDLPKTLKHLYCHVFCFTTVCSKIVITICQRKKRILKGMLLK